MGGGVLARLLSRIAMHRSPSRRFQKLSSQSKLFRGLAIALVVLSGFAVRGLGRTSPAVHEGIRGFNRDWANPIVLRLADRLPLGVARLEYRGRRTGAPYATPVRVWAVTGGFVIPMPYGMDVDWAKNLGHAGVGVLQREGVRYRVGAPRIMPTAEALDALPFVSGRLLGLLGIRHVTRVDVLPSLTTEVSLPA